MDTNRKSPPSANEASFASEVDRLARPTGARAVRTKDHEAIRLWAARHKAEPATGEATASGPATVAVTDGGSGLRFNFPGFARFRGIGWDEWFEHFDRRDLAFIYEEEVADRAHELAEKRGTGQDGDYWHEAERELGGATGGPMGRYRIAKPD